MARSTLRRSGPTPGRSGLVVALVALFLLGVFIAPARAHSELVSSDPADAASLQAPPKVVTLTFSEDVLAQGSAVTVTHVGSGERLQSGPTNVDGPDVSVTWPRQSPAGAFRIAYRVVSADGHPIQGNIRITVAEPSRDAAAVEAPDEGLPSAAAATASVTPAPSASLSPAGGDDGGRWLAWVLGLGLAVLVGASAGTWIMRRSR